MVMERWNVSKPDLAVKLKEQNMNTIEQLVNGLNFYFKVIGIFSYFSANDVISKPS